MPGKNSRRFAACLSAVLMTLSAAPAYAKTQPPSSAILMTKNDTIITKGAAAAYLRYTQALTYERYTMYYNIYERDIGQFWSAKNTGGKTNSELIKDTIKNDLEIIAASVMRAGDYGITISEKEKTGISKAADEFLEQTDNEALEENDITKADVESFLTMELIREKVKAEVVKDTDRKVSTKEKQQCSISCFAITESSIGKTNTAEKIEKKLSGSDASAYYKTILTKAGEQSESTGSFSYYSYANDYTSGRSGFPLEVMKKAVSLSDGQYAAVKADGVWYFIHMISTNDKAATNKREQEIVEERADELFDNTAQKWIDESGIKFDDQMWRTLPVNDTVVYQPYEEDEKTNISQTESATEAATENTTEGTTENN